MSDGGEYRGEEVRGFLATDDASTAVEVQLRPLNFDGSTFRALTAGERLVIDSIMLANGATASVITLFQDWNDDGTVNTGEEILSAALAANSNASPNLNTPIILNQKGTGNVGKVKVKASVASTNTRIFFTGRIVNT